MRQCVNTWLGNRKTAKPQNVECKNAGCVDVRVQ